ncbi:MAG: hypothetical protein AW08_01819 [Candidatus Accumulibacter adjunctus]|uniref:Uncharacterized protein n=1 Tax=Candidatus Accumulibacter adjunctus TaxID=1454001 RepID=A0A011MCT8_9PROT|nr:MAG: hypothetical protein AW08_01819 [Candidatus Accumulibacter adjunctus]
MQPVARLALVVAVLRAEPEDAGVQRLQLGEVIAEAARLRRAAARTGDRIPAVRQRDARPTGHRIDVEHPAPGHLGQVERGAVGRGQRQFGQAQAREMGRRTVVDRRRQVLRQGKIVHAHRPPPSQTSRPVHRRRDRLTATATAGRESPAPARGSGDDASAPSSNRGRIAHRRRFLPAHRIAIDCRLRLLLAARLGARRARTEWLM